MFHQTAVFTVHKVGSFLFLMQPEICEKRGWLPPTAKVCTKSTPSTPIAQVCQPIKTKKLGYMCIIVEATKLLNPLKYKTPDIFKMLAAKITLLQFCYF